MQLAQLAQEARKKTKHKMIHRYVGAGYANPKDADTDAKADTVHSDIEEAKIKDKFSLETDDTSFDEKKFETAKKFVRQVLSHLKIKTPVKITLTVNRKGYGLRTLAHFINKNSHVVVYSHKRNLADVLRSVAHELVHKKQLDNNELNKPVQDIGGPIEDEANAVAGQLVKAFGYKHPQIFE